ncbi:signal transducing adapter molecule 1 [Halyomorpha halys]|uniref:signal transducing adapter molecule 1 n=1 Tax=Halyomorpha halys TaxID=286706 RepID=UPI0006D4EA1F|nr:signal transducing adapter molecule 1 [Halyomorpha halys]
MGIFSNSSPFDNDVEKATSENNTSEEWGVIMEICDKVGSSSVNAKDCLRSIVKRLHSPDPHVVLQAVTLLDACVNNCGKTFQLEVASRDFDSELKKLIAKWQCGDKVGDRIRNLIKKWSDAEFKADAQLSLMTSLYSRLRQEGVDFSTQSEPPPKTQKSTDPDSVSSQQEVDDIAKAIELSLKESSSPKYNGSAITTGLYPSVGAIGGGGGSSAVEAKKVKALYDFEAAEDNELTFFAGEIIHVLDDSDANWWKGYNKRGEGLFPANFVTSNLSEAPVPEKKGVQFNESVEVKPMPVTEIDEEKIDRVLQLLHDADPRSDHRDSDEMRALEDEVTRMGPLIDAELERVDRKHAQLTTLSSGLVDALNLYHGLMREPKPQWFPPPPEYMYQQAPPPHVYPQPPHHPPPPFHHPHPQP